MDFMAQEQERGITIQSAATTCRNRQTHDTEDKHRSTSSIPGPRGLHCRGRAPAARPRLRRRRVDGKEGVSRSPDRVASADKMVSRASASSTRWTSRAPTSTTRPHIGAAGRHPAGRRADRRENDFVGVDLIRMKAYVWNDVKDDMGAHHDTVGTRLTGRTRPSSTSRAADMVAESDEELLEKYRVRRAERGRSARHPQADRGP